jgi:hypothetical protein
VTYLLLLAVEIGLAELLKRGTLGREKAHPSCTTVDADLRILNNSACLGVKTMGIPSSNSARMDRGILRVCIEIPPRQSQR